jgi:long-chain fatty acid transport protein
MATNGLNSLGFGLEALAMAGADVAVARDPLALNTNPAGLAQVRGTQVEAQGALVHELGIEHSDRFNPPTDIQNDYFPVGNLALSQRLDGLPLTLGASLVASGGAGFDYGRIDTAFGTKDRLSSLFGIVRASVGGGMQVTDRLALGASIGLSYSRLDQEFFPDTSVIGPSGPFFGTRIENAWAYGAGFRLGVHWRPLDRLAFGLTYSSKVDLPVEDGRIDVDMTAAGLGKVRYRDLKLDGLAQAQEVGFGIAVQLAPDWLVAADLGWIDWSGALGTTTIRARDPDHAQAPAVLRIESTQDWRDQYVLALGTAYQPVSKLTLWAGYNYGRNPVPNRHLSPLFANIGEHHLTAGAGWQVGRDLRLGLAVEYLLPNEVTYDNPELPFGPDARARASYVALHVGLSWRL